MNMCCWTSKGLPLQITFLTFVYPWDYMIVCTIVSCEVFMLEMLEPHYHSQIDFTRVSDNPLLRQLTNPLMGILHPWKPAFHFTNMWFWCGGNCCDKEIVLFCPLGGLKATTGWLKLISRFILIHKSPLVSRVALTLALEVLESMMRTWVLAFVQKVFFSSVFFHLSLDLRKRCPFELLFSLHVSMGLRDHCVCVHYWTFYVESSFKNLMKNLHLDQNQLESIFGLNVA
jgi:hypothetical protein